MMKLKTQLIKYYDSMQKKSDNKSLSCELINFNLTFYM